MKRPKITRTATAVIRRWIAPDGDYSLAEVKSLFGLPTYYIIAKRIGGGGETLVSRHRKRKEALDKFATLLD